MQRGIRKQNHRSYYDRKKIYDRSMELKKTLGLSWKLIAERMQINYFHLMTIKSEFQKKERFDAETYLYGECK